MPGYAFEERDECDLHHEAEAVRDARLGNAYAGGRRAALLGLSTAGRPIDDEEVRQWLDGYASVTPVPFPCHSCGHQYAGTSCPVCKVDRPAFTALKRITAAAAAPAAQVAPLPPCRYEPRALCGCGLAGLCLETV